MKNYKNYLIALLTGLLVLTLTTQPSIGASNSTKLIQYDRCLAYYAQGENQKDNFEVNSQMIEGFSGSLSLCVKYK